MNWRIILMVMISLGIYGTASAYEMCMSGQAAPDGTVVTTAGTSCLIMETTDSHACRDTDAYGNCVNWSASLCDSSDGAWQLPSDLALNNMFDAFNNDFAAQGLCEEGALGCTVSPTQYAPPLYWSDVSNEGGGFSSTYSSMPFSGGASVRCIKLIPMPLLSPYLHFSDVKWASGFGVDDGIDFHPIDDKLIGFQAVADGTIESVSIFRSSQSLEWQVNVLMRLNDDFTVIYAFETGSTNAYDGLEQFHLIQVRPGEVVSPGDMIGYLFSKGDNLPNPEKPHLHFGLREDNATGSTAVCPGDYFPTHVTDQIDIMLANAATVGVTVTPLCAPLQP